MERVIIKVATAINKVLDKVSSVCLPLLLAFCASVFMGFGLYALKHIPLGYTCHHILSSIVVLIIGLVMWIFAIALALGDLYREH